jgi:hypothetical protein
MAMIKCVVRVAMLALLLTLGSSCPAKGTSDADIPVLAADVQLQGRVYDGAVGAEPPQSTAISGVTVSLYGSNSASSTGNWVRSTTTDSTGYYALTVSEVFEYYYIVESDPSGYTSVGASSQGGKVITSNQIQYTYPLDGKTLTGNKFWDRKPTTPTTTSRPTSTFTPVRPTATHTPKPTLTFTPVPPTPTPGGPTATPQPSTPTPQLPTLTPQHPTATPELPTPTPSLVPECPDLLMNGGFEGVPPLPWFLNGAVEVLPGIGRLGSFGARLGNADLATGELGQQVSIPAGWHPVILHFWWLTVSPSEQPQDVVRVLIQHGGASDLVFTMYAVHPLEVWQEIAFDLTAYAGQTVTVTFFVETDGNQPSSIIVDDVSLAACPHGTGGFRLYLPIIFRDNTP